MGEKRDVFVSKVSILKKGSFSKTLAISNVTTSRNYSR